MTLFARIQQGEKLSLKYKTNAFEVVRKSNAHLHGMTSLHIYSNGKEVESRFMSDAEIENYLEQFETNN